MYHSSKALASMRKSATGGIPQAAAKKIAARAAYLPNPIRGAEDVGKLIGKASERTFIGKALSGKMNLADKGTMVKMAGNVAVGSVGELKAIGGGNLVDKLMQYEAGEMSEKEAAKFLIKNKKLLMKLQGHYGRMIEALERSYPSFKK